MIRVCKQSKPIRCSEWACLFLNDKVRKMPLRDWQHAKQQSWANKQQDHDDDSNCNFKHFHALLTKIFFGGYTVSYTLGDV